MRLCSFEVENFRLFRKARLELHPEVTLLVGRNDVGKSTLLEAMYLYGQVQQKGFRKILERDDFEGTGADATRFRCTWEVDGATWEHELGMSPAAPEEKLSGAPGTWLWKPRERALVTPSGSFKGSKRLRYRSFARIAPKTWQLESSVPPTIFGPTAVTSNFRPPAAYLFQPKSLAKNAPAPLKRPNRSGYGWANWLQRIINRRDGTIKALEAELAKSFPHFRGVRLAAGEENISTSWRTGKPARRKSTRDLHVAIQTSSGSLVWAEKASSGLLLALAHLALVYASPEGSLLLLEEPENGLNAQITMEMMRTFLSAVRRRDQQLVLTTHNEWWLDLVPHDSIRVVTRDEEGGHVEAPRADEIRRIIEERDLYPSEVMSIHGPEGLLRLGRGNSA